MLKTRMTKKLEEMKNGGYTLFSGKARKMLIAMGLSLLSIGTLSQIANAEVVATVTHKRVLENSTNYLVILKETDTTKKLKGVYLDDNLIIPEVGKVEGKQEATIVINIPNDKNSVVIKNDDTVNPAAEENAKTINLSENDVILDMSGPQIVEGSLVKYVSESYDEQSYIQARFTDATKIYRIEDQNGNARALIKEKDKDNEIVLKYILEPNDTEFTIYDILGNGATVKLTDEVKINVVYNTRNIDGTKMALRVTREFEEVVTNDQITDTNVTYTLYKIKTGAGEEIQINQQDQNGVISDMYNIPIGTTKLKLTYRASEENAPDKLVEIPLVLDKDAPVVVAYKETQQQGTIGYSIEASKEEMANARAYFNKDKEKGIVEVKDIKSGIAKIKTLKGTAGNYEEEQDKEAYKSNILKTSILCLFPVTQETTAVRVYDGVGNTIDIPLGLANEQDAITVAKIQKQDDGTYKLIAQDIKAGLGKIQRDGEAQDLANFENADGTILQGVAYEQYTLKRVEMAVDDQGKPVIHIYDALGNEKRLTFDDIAYICHYATFNTTDSLAISVEDSRGISKITVTMIDKDAEEEPSKSDQEAWEEWNEEYRHTYTLEVFDEQNEPKELTKTYQIPEGIVQEVRIYNTADDEALYNEISGSELINISNVADTDRITGDIIPDQLQNKIEGVKVKAKFGVKKVIYDDGCVVQFYDELPTELYVNCLLANESEEAVFTGATVMDALGDTLIIESDKVTFSYSDVEINV